MTLLSWFDANVLLWIQDNLRNPVLTAFFKTITHLGDKGLIWILLTAFLLLFQKTKRIGILSGMALLGSLLINNVILKQLIARIRPYDVIPGLQLLIERQTDFSFPSGHAGSSFAAAVILYKELPKKYGIPALILAVLIAFSRLYVGVHYPTDIIGGAVTGILIALGIIRISFRLDNKNKE